MGWVLSCEILIGFEVLMLLSEAEDNRFDGVMGKPASHLAQSETPYTWRSSLCGTWEVSSLPLQKRAGRIRRKPRVRHER